MHGMGLLACAVFHSGHACGVAQDAIAPAAQNMRTGVHFWNQGVLVSRDLHEVHLHVGIHLLAVFRHQLGDVDVAAILPAVLFVAARSVKTTVAGLHIGIHKHMIPEFLFPDGLVPEQPYTVFGSLTDILTDAIGLIEVILGLTKLGKTVELPNNAATQGAVRKVAPYVKVEEV